MKIKDVIRYLLAESFETDIDFFPRTTSQVTKYLPDGYDLNKHNDSPTFYFWGPDVDLWPISTEGVEYLNAYDIKGWLMVFISFAKEAYKENPENISKPLEDWLNSNLVKSIISDYGKRRKNFINIHKDIMKD